MPPQTSIPLSANILGTIGTICWCVQLVPQILRNYRTKSTEGLPGTMMFLWSASGVPFGVYAITQRFNIPLIVQPQCFCLLCGVTWAQVLVYGRKWRPWTATLVLITLLIVFAALQTGLIFAVRPPYARGVSWPVTLIGAIAFVVLIAGYLPIPFELLKRRGRVVGIDFVFLGIDWFGAFFSLMALVAQNEFDVLFGTLYALCCIIEMSMVASHLIWLLRTRGIRKRAKVEGKSFDEVAEGVQWQSEGVNLESKFKKLVAQWKRKPGASIRSQEDEEAAVSVAVKRDDTKVVLDKGITDAIR
ncbi:PQ loop repeat protein-like protein [Melanomma pulvis-pyrius CBS 109.77]|uniref:PQ loop repeat protein-like protein n=1 Tax=Melanomma pulvis-pyrius CBS 109.77 TaxID=1314802 RepID=A0A6A6XMM0_9PLEO|nr:PQ loop repeat protein-like protein [Melanomma pulvis-pyrius CBS 109.77]